MGERQVPVLRTSNSLIEEEFDSLRSRFEEEMRLMELEMARLKDQMLPLPSGTTKSSTAASTSKQCVSKTTTTTTKASKTTETTASSKISGLKEANLNNEPGASGAFKGLVSSSPLVVDDTTGKGKLLKLRFDLASYEPEQIVVTTLDNRLQVSARREEGGPRKSLVSEYTRDFLLPTGTNPDTIKSTLSADGVLTIEAPLAPEAANVTQ